MSRWAPIPTAISSSLAMADLSPAGRCVWLALRIAHALHGHGGVLPATVASVRGLPLVVPALVAGLDVGDGLAELARVGLTGPHDDGLALADWNIDCEQAPCSSCRRRNPDPRHHRCPACRARDTDQARRATRKRGAGTAQTSRAGDDSPAGQEEQRVAGGNARLAQTNHRRGTDMPRPRPDPTLQTRPDPDHQMRACAREAPASPAGDTSPAAPQQQGAAAPRAQECTKSAGDVRGIAGSWAVEMTRRGIETMRPAIHAADVGRLLGALPGGAPPSNVHDPDAFADARREAWVRVAVWCPSPERLARWCIVAAHRYSPTDVAGYLVVAARRGDAGTVLARHGQGEGVLARADEQALRGEHVEGVAQLVAGGAAVLGSVDAAMRERLGLELRTLLARGRTDGARRVLVKLVGPNPKDRDLEAAVAGILSLEDARRLIA